GLLPAWRATSLDLNSALKESAPISAGPARLRLGSFLVVSQVAICSVLLVSAGLFFRSLQRASEIDLGFRPKNVLLASVDLGLQGYSEDRARQFHGQLVEKVKALPGAQTASLSSAIPFNYQVDFTEITIDGGIPGT